MLVNFYVGRKTDIVINTMHQSADNIDFSSYASVKELISESRLRHLFFDRIVVSNQFFNINNCDAEISSLSSYLNNESSKTEVVIILNKANQVIEESFKKYLNSPQYTLAYLEKTTIQDLLDIIQNPIVEVKAKFYDLDKDKVQAEEKTQASQVGKSNFNDSTKKSWSFGLFKGGKNKDVKPAESKTADMNTQNSTTNVAENVQNQTTRVEDKDQPESNIESANNSNEEENGFQESNENQNIDFDNRALGGESNFNSNDFVIDDDDLPDLNLGEEGEDHADTGFIDDDEEEELRKELEERKEREIKQEVRRDEGIEKGSPDSKESEELERLEEVSNTEDSGEQEDSEDDQLYGDEPVEDEEYSANVKLVIGLHINSLPIYVTTEASEDIKEGKKPLIIDLDENYNSILSFINSEKFYAEMCDMGIKNQKVYSEDGIDFTSNGYGNSIDLQDVEGLIDNKVSKYDEIYVICSIEYLQNITYDFLSQYKVYLVTDVDLSDLINLSLVLTDREIVDLDMERYIMNECTIETIDNIPIKNEDIDYIKDICLFANGCWLDRV